MTRKLIIVYVCIHIQNTRDGQISGGDMAVVG